MLRKIFAATIFLTILAGIALPVFAQDVVKESQAKQFRHLVESVDSKKFSAWEKLNSQGVEFFNAGDYEKSIEAFNKALKLAPDNAITLTNIGAVYLKTGNRAEAEKFFDRAIEADVVYANAHYLRGVMKWEAGDISGARNDFINAHALNNYDEFILTKLEEIFRQTDERDSGSWEILGRSYCDLEKYDKAVEFYTKAVELNPESAAAHKNLGDVYYRTKNFDKAVECYTKAVKLKPDDLNILQSLGELAFRSKDYDKASANFKKILELDSKNVRACYLLGVIYLQANDTDNAQIYLTKAAELAPKEAFVWRGLGDVFHKTKFYEQAIEYYNRALKIDSDDVAAYERLANSYSALAEVYQTAGDRAQSNGETQRAANFHNEAASLKTKAENFLRKANAVQKAKNTAQRFNEFGRITHGTGDVIQWGVQRNEIKF